MTNVALIGYWRITKMDVWDAAYVDLVAPARLNALVCRAIRERRVLLFQYDDGGREVEPHCRGCSKDGNDLLRG